MVLGIGQTTLPATQSGRLPLLCDSSDVVRNLSGALVRPEGPKLETECQEREGVLARESGGALWGSAVGSPGGVRGGAPTANAVWVH